MTRYILTLFAALTVSGCVTLTQPGGLLYRSVQEKKLERSVTLLEQGNRSAAEELMVAMCSEPGVPGVTDQALFRLSLLRLKAGQEKNGTEQAGHYLERLQKEYPASSWLPLAATLNELLASMDNMQQQRKNVKELNLSLTKENRELRQSIEKLKNLELELGKEHRR
jgi:hypothetical protein